MPIRPDDEYYDKADREMRLTEKRIPIGVTLLVLIGIALAFYLVAIPLIAAGVYHARKAAAETEQSQ